MSNEDSTQITLPMMRETLFTAVVADALDSLGYLKQCPAVQFQALTTNRLLVGRCKTTLWADMFHEDSHPYELELKAVDSCQPDDVFIVAAGGSTRAAVWGELLSTAVINSGCVGAIIDGATRDIRQLKEMNFPIFSKGVSPYDSLNRQRVIDIDVTVEIGQTIIHPGDLIFADLDGVVVVPQAVEAEAIRRAWKKVQTESKTLEAIRAGMKASDAYHKFGSL